MEKEKIKALYFGKIAKLNEYNKAYYNDDNPAITDLEYDKFKIEILNLEKMRLLPQFHVRGFV